MEFNVFREQIRSRKSLEQFISVNWNNSKVIYKGGAGIVMKSPESITDSFEMSQSVYCKSVELLVHCFSITFDEGTPMDYILELIDKIKNELFLKYQLIYMIAQDLSGKIEAGFIINSVSYITGKNFCDNNRSYIELVNRLIKTDKRICNIKFGSNVFFNAKGSNMCCYVRKDLDNGI